MSFRVPSDRKGIVMSVPSSPGSATTGAPKKGVSPARNIIGLVVLLALAAVVWLEYSAHFGYNGAVKALEGRTQDEEKGLMDVQEAESLLGKSPDGPGIEVEDNGRTFTKKTYTWRALLRPQTLTAFYTKEATPHLHHFETQGAKYVPEENPARPVAEDTLKAAPDTTKSRSRTAGGTGKSRTRKAADTTKSETETAPDAKKSPTEPTPDAKKSPTESAPDTAKSPTKKE
jgi:hypothetical protein